MNAGRSMLEKNFFKKLAYLISDEQEISDFMKLVDPIDVSNYFDL